MSLGWKIALVVAMMVLGLVLALSARRRNYESLQRRAGRRRSRWVAVDPRLESSEEGDSPEASEPPAREPPEDPQPGPR